MACYLPRWGDVGDGPDEYLCSQHRDIEGYCWGCGRFCGGIESFEFGKYSGFCDNCASELEADDRQWEKDGYDYGYGNFDKYDEYADV